MGKLLWFTSGKGGSGTSTVMANVGYALSELDMKICLIDMNFGYRCLDIILGFSDIAVYNIYDILCSNVHYKKVISHKSNNENLYFLAGSQKELYDFDKERVQTFFSEIVAEFDYVLLDKNINICYTLNDFLASVADNIVITTTNTQISLRANDKVIDSLSEHVKKMELVVNKLRVSMIENETAMNIDEILDMLGINLLGIVPCEENMPMLENLSTLSVSAAKSNTSVPLRNIARRILGEKVPIWDLQTHQNILSIIKKVITQ